MSVPNLDSGGVAIEDKTLGKEDIVDILAEETTEEEALELEEAKKKTEKKAAKDDKEDKDKDRKDGDVENEEKSLEDEIEEELEEPNEEELELTTSISRREILAKYPNIFKDFPALQNAYYREQKYSEILPTIEDARVAVERSTILDNYEEEIMSNGSMESLLTAVKDGDGESFAKVVDNFLPTLYKIDEPAYYHTIGNIVKHTIITMVRDGKESGTDELVSAANILNQYIFGSNKFSPPSKLSKASEVSQADSSREAAIAERESKFREQQYDSAMSTLTTKTDNIIKATIDKNIDPRDSMSNYVKRNASREVSEGLEEMISKDVRFKGVLDKLWERAFEANFSSESVDRVKSAYLSKAKTLLPQLIRKSRNEALKGIGRRVNDEDDTDNKDKKGPLPVGKTRSAASSTNSGKTDKDRAKGIPKGMTSLEYINSD
jgi:hypothetical protein